MQLSSPFASGRDADVYVLDDARVLRRYRAGGDVSAEVEVMAHVAERGYPVVRVLAAEGCDLVLERLAGPTMLQALASAGVDVGDAAHTLCELLARLHAIPALTAGSSLCVVHLDLHPGNVVITPGGPVVIDWRNARDGAPELDTAITALIIAEAAVDPAHPMRELARALLGAFLRCSSENPTLQINAAVAQRRANPGLLAEEVARLDAAALLVRQNVARGAT